VEGVLITGDLSEGDDVVFQLRRLAESLRQTIFFVLGNHDFYGASIASMRNAVSSLSREIPSLVYLTDSQPVELAPGSFLVGEDGWGDATRGDYENSRVRMNDFTAIEDFMRLDPTGWPHLMRQQGAESAQRLADKLGALAGKAERVLVATHVPPFRRSCWYQGHTTDDNWAPFFVCGQVGETLERFAAEHPRLRVDVVCGHTHHGGTAAIRDNLTVYTAGAEYGAPAVERVLEIDRRGG
jgi:predicted phosphohydrolase